MTNYVEDFQKMSQDNLESAMANAGVVSKVFQEIATETADFSKKAFEEGSATAEKLMSVKTFDKALEIQSDYACLLYTSPSPRDLSTSRMPSSA